MLYLQPKRLTNFANICKSPLRKQQPDKDVAKGFAGLRAGGDVWIGVGLEIPTNVITFAAWTKEEPFLGKATLELPTARAIEKLQADAISKNYD